MAGSITVSSITLDSDNNFSIRSNTGATILSANGTGLITGIANGASIVSAQLTTPTVSGNLSLDSTGTTGIRVPSANTLAFHEGGVEAMRIDSSGNMGIGTSSPSSKLHVVASTSGTGGIRIESQFGASYFGNYNNYPAIMYDGASLKPIIVYDTNNNANILYTNNTERMRIDADGNVGIGTTSPQSIVGVNVALADTKGVVLQYNGEAKGGILLNPSNGEVRMGAINPTGSYFTTVYANNSEGMRITSAGLLQFNSGYGSVDTAYGCRAWVNFNGTGTPAIRGSGNVSSITDNGTGSYTVNFTNAMPDVNYAVAGSSAVTTGGGGYRWLAVGSGQASDFSMLTTSIRVQPVYDASNRTDAEFVSLAIFR